jgi:hypothetical protein
MLDDRIILAGLGPREETIPYKIDTDLEVAPD